jgi:hypothetical protein
VIFRKQGEKDALKTFAPRAQTLFYISSQGIYRSAKSRKAPPGMPCSPEYMAASIAFVFVRRRNAPTC